MTERQAHNAERTENNWGPKRMNTKTTKQAVTGDTTKAKATMGGKQSRRVTGTSGAGSVPAPRAESAGRRRRKPFVL
jgi:hypothetical protein